MKKTLTQEELWLEKVGGRWDEWAKRLRSLEQELAMASDEACKVFPDHTAYTLAQAEAEVRKARHTLDAKYHELYPEKRTCLFFIHGGKKATLDHTGEVRSVRK